MARRKPLEELSLSYLKRISSAERKGYTRAQARGHSRPGELPATLIRKAEKGGLIEQKIIAESKESPERKKELIKIYKEYSKEKAQEKKDLIYNELQQQLNEAQEEYPLQSSELYELYKGREKKERTKQFLLERAKIYNKRYRDKLKLTKQTTLDIEETPKVIIKKISSFPSELPSIFNKE